MARRDPSTCKEFLRLAPLRPAVTPEPSSRSSTAAARAPMRIDDSAPPLYDPLPFVVGVTDPMRVRAIFASCAANLAPNPPPSRQALLIHVFMCIYT